MKTGSRWKCRLSSVLSVFSMIVFGFFLVSFILLSIFFWFYFSLYFAPHWFCHLNRKTTPIITISHGNSFWGLFNSIFALCVANSLGKLKLRRESGTKFRCTVRIVVGVVGVKWASLCLKSFVLCVLLCAVSALVSKFVKQTEMSRNEMQFLLLLLYFFLPLLPLLLVCLISGASISFCTIKAMVLRIPA